MDALYWQMELRSLSTISRKKQNLAGSSFDYSRPASSNSLFGLQLLHHCFYFWGSFALISNSRFPGQPCPVSLPEFVLSFFFSVIIWLVWLAGKQQYSLFSA